MCGKLACGKLNYDKQKLLGHVPGCAGLGYATVATPLPLSGIEQYKKNAVWKLD